MATYLPVKVHEGLTDLRSAAYLNKSGDTKAWGNVGRKYANIAKNPAKSAWDSFKGIFGFGLIPVGHRRPAVRKRGTGTRKKKPGPKPKTKRKK